MYGEKNIISQVTYIIPSLVSTVNLRGERNPQNEVIHSHILLGKHVFNNTYFLKYSSDYKY